jgi:D-hexose-6-phosphate mutarotase
MIGSAGLNERFALAGQLAFRDTGDGVAVVEITNALATAAVCLQGAHLMQWQPRRAAEPVVWLSPQTRPAPGKSLRGGVPVCWPWFGGHAAQEGYPAHGFARIAPWEVTATEARADGASVLTLRLLDSEEGRRMWPHASELSLRIVVGEVLEMALTTTNLGERAFVIGEALHTYFQVGDIESASVAGLDGCDYLDKMADFARRRQQGPVRFSAETDRVYVDTEAQCVIDDPMLRRRIRIAKSGSRSTVVWNPWASKAQRMGDLGPDGWRRMICVESANCHDNLVEVPPGGRHTLRVKYAVEPL